MDQFGTNPYDFRHPVVAEHLLAGRTAELARIDRAVRDSAQGHPVHVSLVGGEGSGKSSLLHAAGRLAEARDLFAVHVSLTEVDVEDTLSFCRNLLDSTLHAFARVGIIDEDGPLLSGWRRQVLAGDLSVNSAEQPLELGLLAAAVAAGRSIPAVAPGSFTRDIAHLVELAKRNGHRGIAVCVDEAGLLDDNRDIPPLLKQLGDGQLPVMLVTAAVSAGAMRDIAPRSLEQIEVGPFTHASDVHDAVVRPLGESGSFQPALDIAPSTVADIAALTGGQPYEINLVCHYIWEAVHQGEQESFELSSGVLDELFRELNRRGRQDANEQLERIGSLTSDDWQALQRLGRHELLTLRQVALAELMLTDCTEADIVARTDDLRNQAGLLTTAGVIDLEQDRFHFKGDAATRMYLKYAYRRRFGESLIFNHSYGRAATLATMELLSEQVSGCSARVFARGRPFELGDERAGSWVEDLLEATESGDLTGIARLLGSVYSPDIAEGSSATEGLFVLGVVLTVGLEEVEHAELFRLDAQTDRHEDLEEAVLNWFEDRQELLASYDITVNSIDSASLSAESARNLAAYTQLSFINAVVIPLYRAEAFAPAAEMLEAAIADAEVLVTDTPVDPLVRSTLGNSCNCHGFIAATVGNFSDAERGFERATVLGYQSDWLTRANLAYVRARIGEFASAAEELRESLKTVPEEGSVLMLAFLPTPESWEPDGYLWNEVELKGQWVGEFLRLQLRVVDFAANKSVDRRENLVEAVEEMDPAAPLALLRLRAWATLTLLEDGPAAVQYFEKALQACSLDTLATVREELAFVRSLAS